VAPTDPTPASDWPALGRFEVRGVATTLDFHRAVTRHIAFRDNRLNTRWVETTSMPHWSAATAT
jgi:biotin carboxylase